MQSSHRKLHKWMKYTKIHIRFDLKDTVKQDDWQVQIKPAFKPEFNWAPHLTPTVNNIIDQHVFVRLRLLQQTNNGVS